MTATDDFDLTYERYLEQFGHTFNSFLLDDDTRELATLEMLRSLSGERGAITDDDLENIGEGIRDSNAG